MIVPTEDMKKHYHHNRGTEQKNETRYSKVPPIFCAVGYGAMPSTRADNGSIEHFVRSDLAFANRAFIKLSHFTIPLTVFYIPQIVPALLISN